MDYLEMLCEFCDQELIGDSVEVRGFLVCPSCALKDDYPDYERAGDAADALRFDNH